MYSYRKIDQDIVDQRVEEFRDQTTRYLAGELGEDEFRNLRLRNGLYIQRHAPMLRIAIPYGLLSATQLRMLAQITEKYDRGYGHLTTRQNLQLNWPKLEDVPDILADLATVQMHAIQTSGNCVRNISVDQYAGAIASEDVDPRPYAELLRQYSSLHPEFLYLPRKFKIALTGDQHDRAAVAFHDIGLRVTQEDGKVGFEVRVGGGLGRTPVIAPIIHPFLDDTEVLAYTEAILRVYNLEGNRKNKYKARIKILVRDLGPEEFRRRVDEEYEKIRSGPLQLTRQEIDAMHAAWAEPNFETLPDEGLPQSDDPAFARFLGTNVIPHRVPGYALVNVTVKEAGRAPGDITAEEMRTLAAISDAFSLGELRVTHEQNLVLPHVRVSDLQAVYARLEDAGFGTLPLGSVADMICCPGLDFCNLANAASIPVAKDITSRFDADSLRDIGEVKLKMSGCINACGHHHVGHVGILGIDKKGVEAYQIMLGGSATDDASLGRWIGPAVGKDEIADAVVALMSTYTATRQEGETFLQTVRRTGIGPFADAVYGKAAA